MLGIERSTFVIDKTGKLARTVAREREGRRPCAGSCSSNSLWRRVLPRDSNDCPLSKWTDELFEIYGLKAHPKNGYEHQLFVLDLNDADARPRRLCRWEHSIYVPIMTLEELDNNKKRRA